jgi:signal transduction histidine kinase
VAVVTVGALIGYVVAGRLARPVLRLRDVAVELGNGSFTLDVPTSGVREIDEAGRALAATARRLDDALRRERAFSADASHQLRTPLAGLRTGLETELEFPRPDRTEVLHESLDDIGRLETTIRQLLAIARAPNGSTASASAGAVISAAERAWHGRFAAVGRPLVTAGADRAPMIVGHGAVLGQALDVLLDNSLVHGAGETRIDCDATPDSVTISVSDDGLWSDGDGSAPTHGLGLPLARRLVESLPGRLHIVRDGPRSEVQVVVGRADVDDG